MRRLRHTPIVLASITSLGLAHPGTGQATAAEALRQPLPRPSWSSVVDLETPSAVWGPDRRPSISTRAIRSTASTTQEAQPLFATDDLGNPITPEEIQARLRSAGARPGVGGLVGALVGGAVGVVIALQICPIEIFGPSCSPRDDALATVFALGGLAWGGALGVMVGRGHEIDKWEALELIREERRTEGGR